MLADYKGNKKNIYICETPTISYNDFVEKYNKDSSAIHCTPFILSDFPVDFSFSDFINLGEKDEQWK